MIRKDVANATRHRRSGFLGRKVYWAVVVILTSALRHGINDRRLQILRGHLEINRRTLERWRQWWLDTFVHVPMPRRPTPMLVVVQTQLRFVFLETAFDRPSRRADPNQFTERLGLRRITQGILELAAWIIADQQPPLAGRRALGTHAHPHPRKARHQRTLGPLGQLARPPPQKPRRGHQRLSCRGRCFCPSCHEKRALEKAGWVAEHVCAEVPHRQFVFTIPKRLRLYFR
ncbi:MAG: hypothetical protein FJ387_29925, partial [Verrucomicrobia bacterium]|nr:hypothetical protein [Verrucomicrobiota bacterium]